MSRTRVVAADRSGVLGREVHHVRRREAVLRIVERGMIRARAGTAAVEHRRRRRDRRSRRRAGTRSRMMLRAGGQIGADR